MTGWASGLVSLRIAEAGTVSCLTSTGWPCQLSRMTSATVITVDQDMGTSPESWKQYPPRHPLLMHDAVVYHLVAHRCPAKRGQRTKFSGRCPRPGTEVVSLKCVSEFTTEERRERREVSGPTLSQPLLRSVLTSFHVSAFLTRRTWDRCLQCCLLSSSS